MGLFKQFDDFFTNQPVLLNARYVVCVHPHPLQSMVSVELVTGRRIDLKTPLSDVLRWLAEDDEDDT
ncbi:MAG TPA: hypothetical protein VN930_03860 [Xanthobacteraceae bacterium]|nr:hypothetical protein [Xanthobacteraceae bacterium]